MDTGKIFSNVPKSAFQLYIKLFCNRRHRDGITESIAMAEAIKAWVLLSEHERQQFYEKYVECNEKNMKRLGNCIREAEVFVRKRRPLNNSSKKTTTASNLDDIIYDNEITESINHDIAEESNRDSVETAIEEVQKDNVEDSHKELESFINNELLKSTREYTLTKSNEASHEIIEETSVISHPEPLPPAIKSGKELFALIKTNTEMTWDTLSNTERSYYNRAILTLKKDYIHKYKLFLEGLESRLLFEYYNKTIY